MFKPRHLCIAASNLVLFISLSTHLSAQTTIAAATQLAIVDPPTALVPNEALPEAPEPQPQASQSLAPQPQDKDVVTLAATPVNIIKDQGAIWTSPLRFKTKDLEWFLPLAAATGVSLATDTHTMSSVVPHDTKFNQDNIDTSNAIVGGLVAVPVALYGVGHFSHDPHSREAGILGGEALVDSLVVSEGFKLIFWRERPAVNNARGHFFQGDAGIDSSFTSAHSSLAWASAAVIAAEYPDSWVQFGVYSLATAVSLTRVLGQEHFPTDVLVGGATGWLIGHYVFRAHHKYPLIKH